jgi:hypothetical protein
MSGSDPQTDRVVRAWLEDGVTQFPDRLLDGVLDQLPGTRQRQPFRLAGRFAHMNGSLRIALAGIAAVVVVAGGAYLFAGGNIGAPVASPTPTPTASPTPTATPAPSEVAHADKIPERDIALEPGSYSVYSALNQAELRVTLTVPDGWSSHEGWYVTRGPILTDDTGASVAIWTPDHGITSVYPDPCATAIEYAGSDPEKLVTVLAASTMNVGGPPTPITIGEYTGWELHLATDPNIDVSTCAGEDHLVPWGGRWIQPGTEQTIWILDVEGSRVVIEAAAERLADETQRSEMERVLQSTTIELN